MAYQFVYTSVRSGLQGGRSGFCTAARHRLIPDSLISRLEGIASQYERQQVDTSGNPPVIYNHRILGGGDSQYHILMRIGDAGFDHKGRANHIAHAFVFDTTELEGLIITPAEAILHMMMNDRWITSFEGPARYFELEDEVDFSDLGALVGLPADHWKQETSATGNAAWAFEQIDCPREIGFEMAGHTNEDLERILHLYAESLLLTSSNRSDPKALWSVGFTTLLQSSLERRAFPWRGCLSGWELADEESKREPYVELNSPLPLPDSSLVSVAQGKRSSAEVRDLPTSSQNDFPKRHSNEIEVSDGSTPPILQPPTRDDTEEENSEAWQERQHFKNPGCGCRSPGCVILVILLLLGGTAFTFQHNRLENQLARSISGSDWETANRIIFNKVTAADKAKSAKLRALVTAADLGNAFNQIATSSADETDTFLEKREDFESWSKDPTSETLRQSVEEEFLEARSRVHELGLSDLWTQASAAIEGDPDSFGRLANEFERSFPSTDILSPKEYRALVQAENEIREYQEWRDKTCNTEQALNVYRSSAQTLRERYLALKNTENFREERARFYGELADQFGKLIDEKSFVAPPAGTTLTSKKVEPTTEQAQQVVTSTSSNRTFVRLFHIADPSPVRQPVFDFSTLPELDASFEGEFIYRIGISHFPDAWDPNGSVASDRIHLRNVATPLRLSPDQSKLSIDPVDPSMSKLSERAFTLFLRNRNGAMDRLIGLPVHRRERGALNRGNSEVRYCLELPLERSLTSIAPGLFTLAGEPLEVIPGLSQMGDNVERPEFEWSLIIRGHEFSLVSENSSSDPISLEGVRLNLLESIEAEIQRLEEQPSNLEEHERWKTLFTAKFGDLANRLFPKQILEEAQAYTVESDLDLHSIIKQELVSDSAERFLTWDEYRNNALKEGSEAGPLDDLFTAWVNSALIEKNLNYFATPSVIRQTEVFRKYVRDYLSNPALLEESGQTGADAESSEPASPDATSDLDKAIWGWTQLTGASKNDHWETAPEVPRGGTGKREEWQAKLEKFKSDLIFSHFFKAWQEIFTPENLEIARVYLSNSEEEVQRRAELVTKLNLLNENLRKGAPFEKGTVCLKYVFDSEGNTFFIPLLVSVGG